MYRGGRSSCVSDRRAHRQPLPALLGCRRPRDMRSARYYLDWMASRTGPLGQLTYQRDTDECRPHPRFDLSLRYPEQFLINRSVVPRARESRRSECSSAFSLDTDRSGSGPSRRGNLDVRFRNFVRGDTSSSRHSLADRARRS